MRRPPAPHEYESDEIVRELSANRRSLGEWLDNQSCNLNEIVVQSVRSNTFRAFHHLPQRPSCVFREWASAELNKRNAISEFVSLSSQLEYDEWVKALSRKLDRTWKKRWALKYRTDRAENCRTYSSRSSYNIGSSTKRSAADYRSTRTYLLTVRFLARLDAALLTR